MGMEGRAWQRPTRWILSSLAAAAGFGFCLYPSNLKDGNVGFIVSLWVLNNFLAKLGFHNPQGLLFPVSAANASESKRPVRSGTEQYSGPIPPRLISTFQVDSDCRMTVGNAHGTSVHVCPSMQLRSRVLYRCHPRNYHKRSLRGEIGFLAVFAGAVRRVHAHCGQCRIGVASFAGAADLANNRKLSTRKNVVAE